MADLASQKPTMADPTPTLTAASAGGDTAPNEASKRLLVLNTSGASVDVTLAVKTAPDDLPGYPAAADEVIAVGADAVALIPLGNPVFTNDNGRVDITYSNETGVFVAVITR